MGIRIGIRKDHNEDRGVLARLTCHDRLDGSGPVLYGI